MVRSCLIVGVLMLAHISNALAAGSDSMQATLAGLTGVYLVVERNDPVAVEDGLKLSTIKADIEIRLRGTGIRLLSEAERLLAPDSPSLYLRMHSLKNVDAPFYAYCIVLELAQRVKLVRDPGLSGVAVTWESRGMVHASGAPNPLSVRREARDRVDEFIHAYRTANEKQADQKLKDGRKGVIE